jgi:hypothetical protein
MNTVQKNATWQYDINKMSVSLLTTWLRNIPIDLFITRGLNHRNTWADVMDNRILQLRTSRYTMPGQGH